MSFTDEDWAEISAEADLKIEALQKEVNLLRADLEAANRHRVELGVLLRRTPWVEGDLILQGEHEGDVGQVGVTISYHQKLQNQALKLEKASRTALEALDHALLNVRALTGGDERRLSAAKTALLTALMEEI